MRCEKAKAPSKVILLGEHGAVYGHPAVAIPLREPSAEASVCWTGDGQPYRIELPDLNAAWAYGDAQMPPEIVPFVKIIDLARERHGKSIVTTGWTLKVSSAIPTGCGLGSSAAVSAAALKAVFRYFGIHVKAQTLSELVFETEKLHHGTPSGIDNTVIAMGVPILFRKGRGAECLDAPEEPLFLVIGYTGIRHSTRAVIAEVARARAAEPAKYDALFAEIGALALKGADALPRGHAGELGELMNKTQELLRQVGVSCPELEALVTAARGAGALGAKLTGAGRGGCMVAVTDGTDSAEAVRAAVAAAGSKLTVVTGIPGRLRE
ncbi:MAG: mevalonate kinase [Elusimicrobia bacterium GWA2_69_24]|nr:MAG: mevalonate kinase [Elusimicrobia bacterium GWA2_69_24]HBL17557.1 mevalonate kinase [Elusimicrobiota bacterium]